MAMELIKKHLKSLGEDGIKEPTLSKSAEDYTDSLESLLNKVDAMTELHKSAIAENATADASNESAESVESVFTVTKTLEEIEAEKKKAAGSTIAENATADAKNESAESTDTVFTTVRPLGTTAMTAKKQVEIALHKAEEAEEEEDDEEEEKKAGNKLMKSAGVKEEDLEVFDVAAPLADLKKGFDALAAQVSQQNTTIGRLENLFKSLLDVQVKGYSLQKNMSDVMGSYSSQPNQPKGAISILHKSFSQNEGATEDMPTISEFGERLFKSLKDGKVSVDVASNMIASAEATSVLTKAHIDLYKSLGK